jgi:hypothetical protein
MARFGQGVNASLGKTNYSNYLAGALQGAKGVAAGGSAIGQGIANLGEQVGDAIKEYQNNKLVLGKTVGTIEKIYQDSPELFKGLGTKQQKAVEGLLKDGTMKLADATSVLAFLNEGKAQAQTLVDRDLKKAQAENLREKQLPKTPSFSMQQVQAEVASFVKENGRQPDPTELNAMYSKVATQATPKTFQSVEDQVNLQEALGRSKDALAYNSGIVNSSDASRALSRDMSRAMTLLDEGAKTGFGESWLLKGRQALNTLGFDVPGTANSEELRTLLGNQVMARVAQTKGAVSDREMQMFTEYSANFGNSEEGNKQILMFAKKAYDRNVEISRKINSWRQEDLTESQILYKVQNFVRENPLEFTPAKGLDLGDGFTLQ